MTTAPISHSIDYEDDRDLDDAALWAVIDSAEATHSSNKFRKPLAIRYPNFHSPPPKPSLPQNDHHHHHKPHFNISSLNSSPYRRPNKIARTCASSSEVSECTSSPLALIRSPVVKTGFLSSPESYLSPQIGKFGNDGLDVSSVSCVEEKDAVMNHCLNGRFPSVSLFKDYQNSAMAILEKSDFTMISGNPYIKKSGWRKMSCYFNLSYEIKDKTIEFDENRNVQRAEFVVRAHMQGGRFSDGWGSCERREKRFLKPNHDVPSTAETRAKNKACQDLLGIGEYRPGASQHHQKM